MRTLLLSDAHANAEALDAVLEDAVSRRFQRVAFVGDAVGYGPDPAEVLERLGNLGALCVLGNHDAWLLRIADGEDPRGFGIIGQVLAWQLERLSPALVAGLRAWPRRRVMPPARGPRPERDLSGFLVVHGSPRDPDEYVDSIAAARAVFAGWDGPLAVVGHTHQPGVHATLEGPVGEWVRHQAFVGGRERVLVPPRARWIANPGAVGQPRDGDPRASYAVFDDVENALEFFRVEYDWRATAAKIRAAGLPEPIAARLGVGR